MFVLFITISGCDLLKSKEERFLNKLNEGESFTMTMSPKNSEYENEEIIIKVDNDKTYLYFDEDDSVFEIYYTKEDDKYYLYTDLFGSWIKEEIEEFDLSEEFLDPAMLEFDWFEKEDDKYILNEEYYEDIFTETVNLEKIEIESKDDSLIINIYVVDEDEWVQVIINKIGETKIELPEVE